MFMIGYSVSVAKVCARVCQWRRRRRLSSSPKSIDRPGEEESVDKRTSPQELTGLLFPHLTRGSYPIAESAIFFFLLKKKKKKRSFCCCGTIPETAVGPLIASVSHSPRFLLFPFLFFFWSACENESKR